MLKYFKFNHTLRWLWQIRQCICKQMRWSCLPCGPTTGRLLPGGGFWRRGGCWRRGRCCWSAHANRLQAGQPGELPVLSHSKRMFCLCLASQGLRVAGCGGASLLTRRAAQQVGGGGGSVQSMPFNITGN